jgi:Zn-dependent peptidase ImmA (M78 family)
VNPVVTLNSSVLKWARERARLSIENLASKLKTTPDKVLQWERDGKLTFAMAKKIAERAKTPLGYLFFNEPLEDNLPIQDFRTITDAKIEKPSIDLLETIETMQHRQAWFSEILIDNGMEKLNFVGSNSLKNDPVFVANNMRKTLKLETDWANNKNWQEAIKSLRNKIDSAGILIFMNGIVGNDTHRKLSVKEFRGFVLCDDYAPLIFVNNTDALSAQMFTIAHELAHIWINQTGVSNLNDFMPDTKEVEIFCNKVAAEFLVPQTNLVNLYNQIDDKNSLIKTISNTFKVSSLVAARRCLDMGYITKGEFFDFYKKDNEKFKSNRKKQSGGDFWKTQNTRVGERFGVIIGLAAREGRILYNDAYRLTGLYGATFDKYLTKLGIPA